MLRDDGWSLFGVMGWLLTFIWIGVIVFWGVNQISFKGEDNLKGWGGEYTGSWERVYEDGTREPVQLPSKFSVNGSETLVFETVLPDQISEDALIGYYTRFDTKVFIDGEERSSHSKSDSLFANGTVKSRQFQFPIGKEDEGKVLRLTYQDDQMKSIPVRNLLMGDSYGIWRHMERNRGSLVYAAIVLVILSIVFLPTGFILYFSYKSGHSISYLAMGIITVAMWIICDSDLYQYVFGTYDIDGVVAFVMGMLIPYPFIGYMNIEQKRRYQKLYTVLEIAVLGYSLACIWLHITGVANFRVTMPFMNLSMVTVIAILMLVIVVDLIKGQAQDYRLVTVGVLGMATLGIVEVIGINFFSIRRLDGTLTMVGMYFLMGMAIWHMIRQIRVVQLEARDALKASEYKSGFLANMSHEIRTPINAIMGMNSLVLRDSNEQEIREYATNIDNACQSLLSIINDILDISKIESGKMELVEGPYQCAKLLKDVVTMIRVKAEEKKLEFRTEIDSRQLNHLYGDDARIRQIMINVLNNAVKYTKEGSITFKVYGKMHDDEYRLCFEVLDTGSGIKPEAINHLFDAFQRIDEKANKNIEGTGLGLSITKQFVEMMHGEIRVESEYGKGSTFFVEIPQKRVDDETIGNFDVQLSKVEVKKNKTISIQAPDKSILVVDDNKVNQKVFCGLLKKSDLQITCVGSGKECIEYARKSKYDIIFLDHMMPEMDGLETLKIMQQDSANLNAETPIIMLTANAIVGAKERYMDAGCADYLSKPIGVDQLEEILIHYLNL